MLKLYKTFLNLQILENTNNQIKVLIDFKNNSKEYKKEILVSRNEIKDMEDFKIKIDIK